MKIYFFIQLIVNIIFPIVILISLYPNVFGLSDAIVGYLVGYLYFGGGAIFFPICLIINMIFLSVFIRDYKPTGLLKRISWVELFYSIIVFLIIFVWALSPSVPRLALTIRDSVIALLPNKTQENVVKLINDCEVNGMLIDGDRVKILLKNQGVVFASSKDFDALKNAYTNAQKHCR
jgi:hypothetical protein